MKWLLRIVGVLVALLVVLFLIFRTPDSDPDAMRAQYGGAPSQFVTLADGETFHIRDEGPRDALPIILLHGSSSSLHTWDPWAESLSDEFRIIRFDQIGHGLTGPAVDRDYSKASFVADIDAVANHFELDQFVIGGNSMGGWAATSYALAHPERVAGLALLDASGAPQNDKERRLYIGAVIASTPVLQNIMTSITPRSLVKSSLEDSVGNPASISEAKVDLYWDLLRYPGNRQATVDRANTTRGGPFPAEDISGLTMPALVMWGEKDLVTPVSGAKWYDENLPNSRLITYPEIGHLPMEEAPERSAADFREWLTTLEPSI